MDKNLNKKAIKRIILPFLLAGGLFLLLWWFRADLIDRAYPNLFEIDSQEIITIKEGDKKYCPALKSPFPCEWLACTQDTECITVGGVGCQAHVVINKSFEFEASEYVERSRAWFNCIAPFYYTQGEWVLPCETKCKSGYCQIIKCDDKPQCVSGDCPITSEKTALGE